MKVLIVAAHPDDEILGCGGSISKHLRRGDQIEILIITGKRGTKFDQKLDTVPILSINRKIESIIRKFRPARVYCHFINDINLDHQIVSRATLVAARPKSGVRELFFYEVASATEYAVKAFNPNYYVSLKEKDLSYKISIMEKKYAKELSPWPHPRSKKYLEILAQKRGAEVNYELAEAFEVVRIIS